MANNDKQTFMGELLSGRATQEDSVVSSKSYRDHPLRDLFSQMRDVFIKRGYNAEKVDDNISKISVFKTRGQIEAYGRIMKEVLPDDVGWDLDRINSINESIAMDKVAQYLGDRDPTEQEIQSVIKFMKSYVRGGEWAGAVGDTMLGAREQE